MRSEPPARRATGHAATHTGVAAYSRWLGGRICDLPPWCFNRIDEANLWAELRVLDRELRRIIWRRRLART